MDIFELRKYVAAWVSLVLLTFFLYFYFYKYGPIFHRLAVGFFFGTMIAGGAGVFLFATGEYGRPDPFREGWPDPQWWWMYIPVMLILLVLLITGRGESILDAPTYRVRINGSEVGQSSPTAGNSEQETADK